MATYKILDKATVVTTEDTGGAKTEKKPSSWFNYVSKELSVPSSIGSSIMNGKKGNTGTTDETGPSEIVLGNNTDKILIYPEEVGEDDDQAKLVLQRIDYDKRMYSPGHVKLTFSQLSSKDEGGVNLSDLNALLKDFVESGPTFDLQIGDNVIATEYYCYNAKIQNFVTTSKDKSTNKKVATANYRVIIDCYSQDHKLTLFPSCNAWTGKKLRDDIIPDLLKKYGLKEEIHDNTTKLSVLSYIEEGKEKEIKQPYLVQYNETPYDFLCRVANRCGEFLYNEDGKLCVGLKEDVKNTLSETFTAPDQVDAIEQAFVQFGDNINSYNPDVTQFSNNGAVAESALVYNADYAFDHFGATEEQDPFELAFEFWMAMTIWGEMLAAESRDEFIKTLVSSSIQNWGLYNWSLQIAHSETKDKYFDKQKNAELLGLVAQSENIVNENYAIIEDREAEISRGKVTLDFQNATMHSLKLGENVYDSQLGEHWNIVTGIYGYLSKETNENPSEHYVDLVPLIDFKAEDTEILVEDKDKKDEGADNPDEGTETQDEGTDNQDEDTDDEKEFVTTNILPPLDSRPRIRKAAPQEAIVVDTYDPLMLGRIRVKYLWQKSVKITDKDNNEVEDVTTASPWIRMTTPFAGGEQGTGGFFMMPEVGSHVMVNFMHGNMEQPYIDGALFYNDYTDEEGEKYSSPDWGYVDYHKKFYNPDFKRRVLASATGSSLSFIDGSGAIGFLGGMIPAVGAFLCKAPGTNSAIGEAMPGVEGNIVLRDANGINEINMSTSGRSVSVSSPMGKVEISAFTGISIEAPNGDINITGKNVNISAGNNVTIKSGENLLDEEPNKGSMTSFVVGGFAELIAEAGKFAAKNYFIDPSKICDVKFIRSVLEIILRPVEGSLKVMSKRNVMMTAGDGAVTIPASNLSQATKYRLGKKSKQWNELKGKSYENTYALIDTLEAVRRKYKSAVAVSDAFSEVDKNLSILRSKYKKDSVLNDYEVTKKIVKAIHDGGIQNIKEIAQTVGFENHCFKKFNPNIEIKFKGFANRIEKYINGFINDVDSFLDKVLKYLMAINDGNEIDALPDSFDYNRWTIIENIYDNKRLEYNLLVDINFVNEADAFKEFDILKTIVVANKVLLKYDCKENAASFEELADSIEEDKKENPDWVNEIISNAAGVVGLDIDYDNDGVTPWGKLTNWNGVAGPRAVWEVGNGGGIYMSNNPAVTCSMNRDGKSWFAIANPGLERLKAYLKEPEAYLDRQNSKNDIEDYFNDPDSEVKEQDIKMPE